MKRWLVPWQRRLAAAVALSSGCSPTGSGAVDASAFEVPDQPAAHHRLAEMVDRAEQRPAQPRPQLLAGAALARATLDGALQWRDEAERHLERAHRLAPNAPTGQSAAAILGRFLNMRSSTLDLRRVDLQVELYQSLLHSDRPPVDMIFDQFVIHCFATAARALQHRERGRPLRALATIRRLEADLAERTQTHPEEIDVFAMAGNFELTFAAIIPTGRRARLQRAIDYLEVQQNHWDALTPGARNTDVAPNVKTVFAMMLAEAHLAAGHPDRARHHYRRVLAFEGSVPDTAPRRQLAALARHRIAAAPRYAGSRDLLPVWPNGVVGCVACHTRSTTLPAEGLLLASPRPPWTDAP